MRNFAITILTIFLFAMMPHSGLAKDALGIITGEPDGASHRLGKDMKRIAEQEGGEVELFASEGGVDNVYAVYRSPGTQMGIVQSDLLSFVLLAQENPVLARIAKKIKVVLPLHTEAVHLVARGDIASFGDLTGKRVAVGRAGSREYVTARLLFRVSGVVPEEMVAASGAAALSRLKEGELDAMLCISAGPDRLLSGGVDKSHGLRLVAITERSFNGLYQTVEIPASAYGWSGEPVRTVGIRGVLVSFDFRSANCEAVGRFARLVRDRLGWLKRNGQPEWQTVDLEYRLEGWEQYDCVRQHLDAPAAGRRVWRPGDLNPVLGAIKSALSG